MEINLMLLIIFFVSFVGNFVNATRIHNDSFLDYFLEKISQEMQEAVWTVISESDKYQEEIKPNAKITSKNLFEYFERLKRDYHKSKLEATEELLEELMKKEEKVGNEKFNVNEIITEHCVEHAREYAVEAINSAKAKFFRSAIENFQRAKILSKELTFCHLFREFECMERNKIQLTLTADALVKKSSEQVREMQKFANVTNIEHCRKYYEKSFQLKAARGRIIKNSNSRETRHRRSVPQNKEKEKTIQYYKEKYKKKLDKFSKEIDNEYQSGLKQLHENKNKMAKDFSYQIKDTKTYMENAKENVIDGIRNEWQKQQLSKCMENYEPSLKYEYIRDMENRASYCFTDETEKGMKNLRAARESFEDSAVIAVRKTKKNCKKKSKPCYSKKKIFKETCESSSEEIKKNVKEQKLKMENCYNIYSQNLKEARTTYQYMLDHCFQFTIY